MLPHPTPRLRFREMTMADLDAMRSLLGDPEVMTYYPAPKTRDEAAAWIQWNRDNYARDGHGLWIIETHDGGFVGDCGLTWQQVNGRCELEVGYHVRRELQGRGYASEAALACGILRGMSWGLSSLLRSSIRTTWRRAGSLSGWGCGTLKMMGADPAANTLCGP
ncbi:hypothetical protein StoSoilB20_11560 [Arthrobacter sp. StoSoilB20]|nr:hypothetical protein StoSoilB20_11560 [Arthrobacter sp. StoSoilB20]